MGSLGWYRLPGLHWGLMAPLFNPVSFLFLPQLLLCSKPSTFLTWTQYLLPRKGKLPPQQKTKVGLGL